MRVDRGCEDTEESELNSLSLLIEGALEHGRVSYVLYVY